MAKKWTNNKVINTWTNNMGDNSWTIKKKYKS